MGLRRQDGSGSLLGIAGGRRRRGRRRRHPRQLLPSAGAGAWFLRATFLPLLLAALFAALAPGGGRVERPANLAAQVVQLADDAFQPPLQFLRAARHRRERPLALWAEARARDAWPARAGGHARPAGAFTGRLSVARALLGLAQAGLGVAEPLARL